MQRGILFSRVRGRLLLLATLGVAASAQAVEYADKGYDFREAAKPNWHPLALKLQPQLKEFSYAWSGALSSCYNVLHSRIKLGVDSVGSNPAAHLNFADSAHLRQSLGDLWTTFSQDPPEGISEGCQDDYLKAQNALKRAVEVVNGLDLVSPGKPRTPFQKETNRLHMEIEAARVGMLVAFCKTEYRKALQKAVSARYPQDFSGSLLGDGPLQGAADVARVETAQAILAGLPVAGNVKGEVRCGEEVARLNKLLGELKTHLESGGNAAYLKSLPAVSDKAAEDCFDFLIDSSSSMDGTVLRQQQALQTSAGRERMDLAKAEVLRQIDELKANARPSVRVGLSVLGRNGIYRPDVASGCEQVASILPLASLQKNELELRSWVNSLFPDASVTPLSAGWVVSAMKLMRCSGEKTLEIATDGKEEGCNGGNPCDIIDTLDKFGVHINVKIINIGSPGLEKELQARYGRCGAQVVTPGLTGQFHFPPKESVNGTHSFPPVDAQRGTAGKLAGDQKSTSLKFGTSNNNGKSLNGVVGRMGNDGTFVPHELGNGRRVKGAQTNTPEEKGSESSDSQTFSSGGGDSALEAPVENAGAQKYAPGELVPYAKKVSPVTYGQEMKTVTEIENRLYGHLYPKDSDEDRVQRLEKNIFGSTSEGAINPRVRRLRDALPANKDEALPDPVNSPSAPAAKPSSHVQAPGLPESNSKSLMSPLPEAGFTPAVASGISSAPMASPDPLSAEIQSATEQVLRPGVYHGRAIDPTTGKKRDCTVAVTYSGQWNFLPTSMVQVNAWFSDDVKPGPQGTQQIVGKTWSVAFGQPDNYSKSQTTLEYAPKIGALKSLDVPVPVLSEDSEIKKGALEITGRQIGYRFADEHPDQALKRTLQGGYQFTRPVKTDDNLRMVEKAFKVGASMDRDCNLSEITIGVQNTDLQGSGAFTKDSYDAWKGQPKPFATDHTMKCTGLSRDVKASSTLPAHPDTCQKAPAAESDSRH